MSNNTSNQLNINDFYAMMRYIHNHYLHRELRPQISPADIERISAVDEDCNVWEGIIPETLSERVIHDTEAGIEKIINGDIVRKVMVACIAYLQDCGAKLTDDETRTAINLNAWLIVWEKQQLARCIRLRKEIERQICSGDSWLTDYEINMRVKFYARGDDPFSYENMPDSWNGMDGASLFLCQMEMLCTPPILAEEAIMDNYFGIGDSQDHNTRRNFSDEPVNQVRHCHTFHELYDHLCIPMKHMGRIGYISTDIFIHRQTGSGDGFKQ